MPTRIVTRLELLPFSNVLPEKNLSETEIWDFALAESESYCTSAKSGGYSPTEIAYRLRTLSPIQLPINDWNEVKAIVAIIISQNLRKQISLRTSKKKK